MASDEDAQPAGIRYAGVTPPFYPGGKWRAFARIKGRQTHVGHYPTATEAARARDAAIRRHREAWNLPPNFPLPGEPRFVGRVEVGAQAAVEIVANDGEVHVSVRGGPGRYRLRLSASVSELDALIAVLERARNPLWGP
jgi:hypothetical protein